MHYIFKKKCFIIFLILDIVSHVSASSNDGSTTIYRRPGRLRIRSNVNVDNRQWRADDNIIDDFVFNPDNTNAGINPDLFDTL